MFEGNDEDFPDHGSVVTVHLKMAIDGVEFENTRKRKRPFRFTVGTGSVIQGLEMIITHLSIGTKVMAILPPDVAYGEAGMPPKVPRGGHGAAHS